jgi:hypothetical protein
MLTFSEFIFVFAKLTFLLSSNLDMKSYKTTCCRIKKIVIFCNVYIIFKFDK